jgi:hypothetical protein
MHVTFVQLYDATARPGGHLEGGGGGGRVPGVRAGRVLGEALGDKTPLRQRPGGCHAAIQ